jgi:hypothetical protein
MSAPTHAFVVIHGHFYQPPRENPWTGQVDAEASAAPAGFIDKLGDARSNDPKAGTAVDVFRQSLQATPS